MPTLKEKAEELQKSIDEEFAAAIEKLSFWDKVAIGAFAIITIVLALAACAALATALGAATGPAGPAVGIMAWVKCIGAALVAIFALFKLFQSNNAVSAEVGKLEGKKAALDILTSDATE